MNMYGDTKEKPSTIIGVIAVIVISIILLTWAGKKWPPKDDYGEGYNDDGRYCSWNGRSLDCE